jgi:F-type H+-transporting ATPase subunit c
MKYFSLFIDFTYDTTATKQPNPGAALAPLGAGMIVIGAAIGIGMFATAAANAISRQPEAAKDITGAVNLPLFLLEGVAIIALVVCILAVVS